ncbi:MAG: hypothetical protein NC904_04655, partial [Candidatus Omnitrophica bacterium]|nr:hypothetical protein [Candidatus Omnitrophota bacterium]
MITYFAIKFHKRLKTVESEVAKLKQELEEVKAEKIKPLTPLEEAEERLKGLQAEIQELEQRRAEYQQELEKLRLERDGLKTEVDRLTEERGNLTTKIDSLKEERERIQAEIQRFQEQREELQSQLAKVDTEVQNLEQRKKALEDELTKLKESKKALEDEFTGLSERQDLLIRQFEETLAKTEQAKQELETLRSEAQVLTGAKAQLEEEIKQLEEERERIKQELASLEREKEMIEAEKLEEIVVEAEAKVEEARRRFEELEALLTKLQGQKAQLENEITGLQNQRQQLQADLIQSQEEKQRLQDEINRLKEEAKKLRIKDLAMEAYILLYIVSLTDENIIYSAVIQQIESIGIEGISLEEVPIKNHPNHQNIIVKIPASAQEYGELPKIILNAHIDIYEHGFHVFYKGKERPFIPTGALDDRAGVVSIIMALKILKQRWEKDNIQHGPIWVIFTDLEECKEGREVGAGAIDLKDKYQGEQSQEAENEKYKDLFDNTHLIITVDGPLDHEKESYENDKNPFVLAGSYDKNDSRYQAIVRAVSKLGYNEFSNPRCALSDGYGDHYIFREIEDKKLGCKLLVINIRAPHINYHNENETTDIENQIVPVAQWLAESIIELTKDLMSSKQTSAIAIRSKANRQPEVIWEYHIREGNLSPLSHQIGPLSMAVLDSLNRVFYKLRDSYTIEHINKIKTIKVVKGNDKLATVDIRSGEVVLDINVFGSEYLLLMELEHELLHLLLGSQENRAPPAIEEIIILLQEISRFLSFKAQQKEEVLSVLKDDNDIDDKEFYRILERAMENQRIFFAILEYLRNRDIYPADIYSYISSTPFEKIVEEVLSFLANKVIRVMAKKDFLNLLHIFSQSIVEIEFSNLSELKMEFYLKLIKNNVQRKFLDSISKVIDNADFETTILNLIVNNRLEFDIFKQVHEGNITRTYYEDYEEEAFRFFKSRFFKRLLDTLLANVNKSLISNDEERIESAVSHYEIWVEKVIRRDIDKSMRIAPQHRFYLEQLIDITTKKVLSNRQRIDIINNLKNEFPLYILPYIPINSLKILTKVLDDGTEPQELKDSIRRLFKNLNYDITVKNGYHKPIFKPWEEVISEESRIKIQEYDIQMQEENWDENIQIETGQFHPLIDPEVRFNPIFITFFPELRMKIDNFAPLLGSEYFYFPIAVTSDGTGIFAGILNQLRYYNIKERKAYVLGSFDSKRNGFSGIAVSPDDRYVATLEEGGTKIWDLRNNRYTYIHLNNRYIYAISFLDNGDNVLLLTNDGAIRKISIKDKYILKYTNPFLNTQEAISRDDNIHTGSFGYHNVFMEFNKESSLICSIDPRSMDLLIWDMNKMRCNVITNYHRYRDWLGVVPFKISKRGNYLTWVGMSQYYLLDLKDYILRVAQAHGFTIGYHNIFSVGIDFIDENIIVTTELKDASFPAQLMIWNWIKNKRMYVTLSAMFDFKGIGFSSNKKLVVAIVRGRKKHSMQILNTSLHDTDWKLALYSARCILHEIKEFLSNIFPINIYVAKGNANTMKGKGMFTPEARSQIEKIIQQAKQEGRGYLIWGDIEGWQEGREEYSSEIRSIVGYLQRYPKVSIHGLGVVDIPNILSSINIILIYSRDRSPGLLVKDRDSYQVAFSNIIDNYITIDGVTYSCLQYNYRVALLAHEAIELGAMKLCQQKSIPWTMELAGKVDRIAEDYEIQIVGRSSFGRGSRLDERIEQILGFTTPLQKLEEISQKETVDKKILTIEERRIFDDLTRELERLLSEDSSNLPAKLEDFPAPIAEEIKKAYELLKVKGIPIDIEFLALLVLFFSRLFPNHIDKLSKYLSKLFIYLIDNEFSTFGATLRGNTLYLQKSCIEDLLGRKLSIEEVYQAIAKKDPEIMIVLFRIFIHEIGSAFFKLSHPTNQDLEKLFLAMLS